MLWNTDNYSNSFNILKSSKILVKVRRKGQIENLVGGPEGIVHYQDLLVILTDQCYDMSWKHTGVKKVRVCM